MSVVSLQEDIDNFMPDVRIFLLDSSQKSQSEIEESWQSKITSNNDIPNVQFFNNMGNVDSVSKRIKWENMKIAESDIICMWFTEDNITKENLLYMGRWVMGSDKRIVIGIEKDVTELEYVTNQVILSRPYLHFARDFELFKADLRVAITKVKKEKADGVRV